MYGIALHPGKVWTQIFFWLKSHIVVKQDSRLKLLLGNDIQTLLFESIQVFIGKVLDNGLCNIFLHSRSVRYCCVDFLYDEKQFKFDYS